MYYLFDRAHQHILAYTITIIYQLLVTLAYMHNYSQKSLFSFTEVIFSKGTYIEKYLTLTFDPTLKLSFNLC